MELFPLLYGFAAFCIAGYFLMMISYAFPRNPMARLVFEWFASVAFAAGMVFGLTYLAGGTGMQLGVPQRIGGAVIALVLLLWCSRKAAMFIADGFGARRRTMTGEVTLKRINVSRGYCSHFVVTGNGIRRPLRAERWPILTLAPEASKDVAPFPFRCTIVYLPLSRRVISLTAA